VYIGAAILPRPLFVADFDDYEEEGDDKGHDDDDAAAAAAAAAVRPPRIGCATVSTVDPDEVAEGTTRYSRVLSSEFNSVVIEHHLKWSPLAHALPGPVSEASPPETRLGRYDFRHADDMVDWAIRRGLHVKGHVLVWHVTSPPFLEHMRPDEVRSAVRRHIFATVGYFRDRIKMWDVVNKALAGDGSLVENVFYRKMGPGYVSECFRWAHEADPDAFLIYNDNKVEGCGYSPPPSLPLRFRLRCLQAAAATAVTFVGGGGRRRRRHRASASAASKLPPPPPSPSLAAVAAAAAVAALPPPLPPSCRRHCRCFVCIVVGKLPPPPPSPSFLSSSSSSPPPPPPSCRC